MSRRLAWSGAAVRELRHLDRAATDRVRNAVQRYGESERGDVVRLQGIDPPAWRLRVGDYRVLFHVEDAGPGDADRREWMVVEHILHRREAYR